MSNLVVNMTVTGNTSDARNEVKALGTETKKFGDTSARATEATSRGFKQLKASIDPVYRAELELEKAQRLLNQAVRSGVTTQGEAVKIAAQLAVKNNVLATSMANVGRKSRISGHQLQNVSFQVGDFATQVGAGTAASVALGQQLPQLLGGFGILGAVLGAVAAIAVPLTRVLFSSADAVEDNIDPLNELTTSVNAYRAAAGDAASSTEDLISTYGSASDAVRELLDLQEDLALRQAKSDLNAAVGSLLETGSIGEDIVEIRAQIATIDFGDTISPAGKKNLADLEALYRDLGTSLGITTGDAKDLIDALEATSTAGTPKEQLAWLTAIREGYLGLVGDVADLTNEQAAFLQEIKNAELEAQKLVATAGGIAPGIDAAASSASILALNLRNAYDAASQLSNLQSDLIGRETDAALREQFADDPVSLATAQAGAKFDRQNPVGRGLSADQLAARGGLRDRELALARQEAERRLADRGSRGGGSSATRSESEAVQKLIDGLKQEIELLGELDPVEQEMIQLRGQLGDATAAETEMVQELIEKRNEEREQLESNIAALDFMRDSFRSFLDIFRRDGDSSLTFLEKLWGSLDSIGSKLTDLALNNLTDSLFGSSGSSSGGGIGDFFSNLLGNLNLFADGDVFDSPTMFGYGSGQLGIMGEAGREGIMPLEHSFGDGVGAKLGGSETTLPLTRLNSGKLGVSLFANGGTFGGYAAPVRMSAAIANDAQAPAQFTAQGGGGGVVNHWHVSSDSPRSFAESKATMARGANRMMAGLGRHS